MCRLECSSAGDRRFSALYAKVSVFGHIDTIENHYQLCKRWEHRPAPVTWRDGKGKKPDYVEIRGRKLDARFARQFYALLWFKYLQQHPELVAYARKFTHFTDRFATKGGISQADMIALYMQHPSALRALGQELEEVLK